MDGQDTISTLFRAISDDEVQGNLSDPFVKLRQALADSFRCFREATLTPQSAHQFECRVERIVRQTARSFLQWCLGSLETEKIDSMPGTIRYRNKCYRRLSGKTQHANILTRFGNTTLMRAVYRRGSRGKVIAPPEKALGIAPQGYFEMASVATLSIFSEGKRLGTVYLAAAPRRKSSNAQLATDVFAVGHHSSSR